MDNNLKICRQTREIAITALKNTLENLLTKDKISEAQFRNSWLEELRKNEQIFPNGWYIPPPHGIITLFATDKNPTRVLYPSMRPQDTWPRDDIYLDKVNGLIALYASPVDRQTGIIGDTEVMLYLGKNKEIQSSQKICYQIIKDIFDFAKVGQRLSKITNYASNLFGKNNLTSNVYSVSDPYNLINIGHTIPASYENWHPREKAILKNGQKNWETVCNMISKKRIFLNESEDFIIKSPMALTLEPRVKPKNKPDLPCIWIHSIVFFKEDGKKEIFHGFDEIYKMCGMDYLLN